MSWCKEVWNHLTHSPQVKWPVRMKTIVMRVGSSLPKTWLYQLCWICPSALHPAQCLSHDLDFLLQKRSYLKKFRELFAKERSYPSTTKLHDEARKQVRRLYITCTEYVKTRYSSIINYVIIWSTCKWLIIPMPFEKRTIFVTEKDIICKKKKKKKIYIYKKKTLFVPEKDVTICENDVAITV